MGEDEGRKLLLIGEEMAAMDVGDGNLVLLPQGFAANERTIIIRTLNETNSQVAGSPLALLADNAPAVLNEVVVCEHQEVSEGSGACSCSSGSGDEVLQGSVESEGGKEMLLIHSEASCVMCMCEQGEAEVLGKGRNESEGVARNLPWSLSLSPTSSQAFCRLFTIPWYSL